MSKKSFVPSEEAKLCYTVPLDEELIKIQGERAVAAKRARNLREYWEDRSQFYEGNGLILWDILRYQRTAKELWTLEAKLKEII